MQRLGRRLTPLRTYMLPVYALLLLALAGPALAVDGVLEINQTCAVQTGCFAGDTPGFPVTITVAGSYRLTSNLSLTITLLGTTQDANFIEISADDVTMDLGGFRISCAVIFIGGGGECSGLGSGVVASGEPLVTGTSVKNGSIRGMGGSGVNLGDRAEVTHLRAQSNNGTGIQVGGGSTVSGNIVSQNGGIGIITAAGSTVSGNTAHVNGGDGIFASSGSTVSGNTVSRNTGFGLRFLDDTGSYRANTIDGKAAGTVSLGLNAGGNVCNGTLTCP